MAKGRANERQARPENRDSRSPQRKRRSRRRKTRLAYLRQGQADQLHNHPYLSVENIGLWLHVSESKVWQQKLKVYWNPVWNYHFVGKMFLVFSAILVPLGAFLLILNSNATDLRVNYGLECKSSRNYLKLLRSSCFFCAGDKSQVCTKQFYYPNDKKTPIYVYYEVDNFYQNHRQLVKSTYDYGQLYGRIFNSSNLPIKPTYACHPFINDSKGHFYYPCGAMANAMFSDDFKLKTGKGDDIKFRTKGITHSILKGHKFQNPEEINSRNFNHKKIFTTYFVKPRDWTREVWDRWWAKGGMENEAFMNWMIPSARPKFRKLYAIIDTVPGCPYGIFCKGNYSLDINYRFDTDSFKGKKTFILATNSIIGTRKLTIPSVLLGFGFVLAAWGYYMLSYVERRRQRILDRQRKRLLKKQPQPYHEPLEQYENPFNQLNPNPNYQKVRHLPPLNKRKDLANPDHPDNINEKIKKLMSNQGGKNVSFTGIDEKGIDVFYQKESPIDSYVSVEEVVYTPDVEGSSSSSEEDEDVTETPSKNP